MWDERFSAEHYVYGKEPNAFFKDQIDQLSPGRVLFIGEGEGRNAVYAASKGWIVDAVDISHEAKKKADGLAAENGGKINFIVADIAEYTPPKEFYDLIVLIFFHVMPDLREESHSQVINALKTGGRVVIECYEKEQLKYKSGGPKNEQLLYSLEDIYTDFNELEIITFSKQVVNLDEGPLHQGDASVIRYVGEKQF
jgi:cyclopropane fatty-acyl-phospholipid synthase-like methyltransferase